MDNDLIAPTPIRKVYLEDEEFTIEKPKPRPTSYVIKKPVKHINEIKNINNRDVFDYQIFINSCFYPNNKIFIPSNIEEEFFKYKSDYVNDRLKALSNKDKYNYYVFCNNKLYNYVNGEELPIDDEPYYFFIELIDTSEYYLFLNQIKFKTDDTIKRSVSVLSDKEGNEYKKLLNVLKNGMVNNVLYFCEGKKVHEIKCKYNNNHYNYYVDGRKCYINKIGNALRIVL